MSSRRRLNLGKVVAKANENRPLHKQFVRDLMMAIEDKDMENRRPPSKWYKPSSFNCMRQMYFIRTEEPVEAIKSQYNGIGMADTGTRRHEAIQEALLYMNENNYDWEYINVPDYIAMRQAEGKCKTLKVRRQFGAETLLFDSALMLSFMCDGIIKHIPTGTYYLFEFKNQISFKYDGKTKLDDEHINQVACYCTALELDNAFVVYENRDICTITCHETFHVSAADKQRIVDIIMTCEDYVEKLTPPPVEPSPKLCRWCRYLSACKREGQ